MGFARYPCEILRRVLGHGSDSLCKAQENRAHFDRFRQVWHNNSLVRAQTVFEMVSDKINGLPSDVISLYR